MTTHAATLMMQLGVDGVFVGSGIFKSGDLVKRGKAIVQAVTHYNNPKMLAEVSANLGEAMVGITDLENDRVNFRDREGGNPAITMKKQAAANAPHGTWLN